MRGMGKGLKEFKKAQSDIEAEINKVIDAPEVKTTKSEKES